MRTRYPPWQDRFWGSVNRGAPEECWEWTGARNHKGYGCGVRVGDGRLLAHRHSWEIHNGRPIPDGLLVCHHCDNPPCVNPAHLFLGTTKDNTRDAMAKGRLAPPPGLRGSQNGTAKLTEAEVQEIRRRYAAGGIAMAALGQEFGIGAPHVHDIVHRKCWAWLA